MKADIWNTAKHGPISESAIRELHRPPDAHRISPSVHDGGTHFQGTMRYGRVYVLAGHCAYSFRADSVRLGPGEFCDLEQGDYDFQVLGGAPCSLVLVWDLSGFFRSVDGKLPH